MYAIKRISEEYSVKHQGNIEISKVVSVRKTKGDAEKVRDDYHNEVMEDKERYSSLYSTLISDHNGNFESMKKVDPEGVDFIHKFRDSKMENYLRHEIELVGKWSI